VEGPHQIGRSQIVGADNGCRSTAHNALNKFFVGRLTTVDPLRIWCNSGAQQSLAVSGYAQHHGRGGVRPCQKVDPPASEPYQMVRNKKTSSPIVNADKIE